MVVHRFTWVTFGLDCWFDMYPTGSFDPPLTPLPADFNVDRGEEESGFDVEGRRAIEGIGDSVPPQRTGFFHGNNQPMNHFYPFHPQPVAFSPCLSNDSMRATSVSRLVTTPKASRRRNWASGELKSKLEMAVREYEEGGGLERGGPSISKLAETHGIPRTVLHSRIARLTSFDARAGK